MDYLKREINDLQMDLEDVEQTLQINKNIINVLMGGQEEGSAIRLLQIENEKLTERNKKLELQRNEYKDEILLVKQMNIEHENKIEEISISYDWEIARLIDQNDRKEYALQFLEQRLVELEGYLRELAQSDEGIREQLQYFKVNPDLK